MDLQLQGVSESGFLPCWHVQIERERGIIIVTQKSAANRHNDTMHCHKQALFVFFRFCQLGTARASL